MMEARPAQRRNSGKALQSFPRESRLGFLQVVAMQMNLELTLRKNGDFFNLVEEKHQDQTVTFRSLKSCYVEDRAYIFHIS